MLALLALAQVTAGLQATPAFTHVNPAAGRGPRSEIRVVAPAAFVAAATAGGGLRLHAMLNMEGWTMPGGHLSTGAWGEGFVDRRHPHALAHEIVVTAQDLVRLPGGLRWSLTAGRGFAPFGTDDPMSRPAIAYPVNHHWSQVLERLVTIAGLAAGPVTLEAGLFNGDEPEHYDAWPSLKRFGDSWSMRARLRLVSGIELGISRAFVASPEARNGSGLDHVLWNVSAALTRETSIGGVEALAEWSHADEEGAYRYASLLLEAQLAVGESRAYVRGERTARPEERVNVPPYDRSPRPHNENSNLGTTRWTILTAGYARRLPRLVPAVNAEAVFEANRAHVTVVTGPFIDLSDLYGRNDLWVLSVGIRIAAGAPVHRMGRYGVAATPPSHEHHH